MAKKKTYKPDLEKELMPAEEIVQEPEEIQEDHDYRRVIWPGGIYIRKVPEGEPIVIAKYGDVLDVIGVGAKGTIKIRTRYGVEGYTLPAYVESIEV